MSTRLSSTFTFVILLAILSACVSTPEAVTWLRETDSLADVVADARASAKVHGRDRILVVLDIDNTLIAMEQGLGSDQWYDWQKELQHSDPCDARLVNGRLAVQGALYFSSAMRPTETRAAALVKQLQDDGLKLIALTSRGPQFRLVTFRELRRNGISFFPSAIGPALGYLDDFIPAGASRNTRYEEGVYMTSGQHKGEMLKALLKKTATAGPAVLIMADDKQRNLQTMLDTFEGTATAVHAWRYTREDQNVNAFDGDDASVLWLKIRPALQQIQKLLGDDNFFFSEQLPPDACKNQ
jgi:hypothetical protein